jgi:hypothetical protein
MRSSKLVVAALVSLGAAAGPVHADVFSIRAEAHGGAVGGKGVSGDAQDASFFEHAPHGAYGVLVGAEVLFIDAWIQHHQFVDGDRLTTWTQFAAGLDIQIPFGAEGAADPRGKRAGPKNYAELGVFAAAGFGTGQQVDPPLDKTEISDKGFLLEADLAFGHRLNSIMDIGVRVPVSLGYFLKDGFANDLSNHYWGVQAEALLYLRFTIGVK